MWRQGGCKNYLYCCFTELVLLLTVQKKLALRHTYSHFFHGLPFSFDFVQCLYPHIHFEICVAFILPSSPTEVK